MQSKIYLQEMRFYAHHGLLEQEKKVGNWFTVDLKATADITRSAKSDALEDTLDYSQLYAIVEGEMVIPSRLLEHLAGRIIQAIHEAFPAISELEVKVQKDNPPFKACIGGAGVILKEIFPQK